MIPEKHNQQISEYDFIPDVTQMSFRPYRQTEDLAIIVQIAQKCLDADGIDHVWTVKDVSSLFAAFVGFDPLTDVLFAEIDGKAVGYIRAHWTQEPCGTRIYNHNGCVLPEWRRRGIGNALLRFSQRRLRQIAAHHTHEGERYFQSNFADEEIGSRIMLEGDGYQPVRAFYLMRRSLKGSLPENSLPEGLEVRTVRAEHHRTIWEARDQAFEDHWGYIPANDSQYKQWLQHPSFQPELWKVAWDGEQVAGMVLNYIDHGFNRRFKMKRGYTEDICVGRAWRRRGLARALLTKSLHMFKQMDMQEACLSVDTQNTSGALRLYESVGFTPIRCSRAYRKTMSWPASTAD